MSLPVQTALAVLFVLAGSAQALTRYPPANDLSDLDAVVNGTGAPGIYNTSYPSDAQYGIYDWCDMPHVRKQEYKVPSSEYKLQYVEIIQRHHKRTPYASNTFFKEDMTWNCTGEGPYAYAKSDSGLKTTPVYWQAQRGSVNPFEYTVGPGFPGSTCQFPAITSDGLDDAKAHGQDVQAVYGELLQFLPLWWEKEKYEFRVTNNVITSQTLGGFARGLYPDLQEYPASIQSSSYDSLEPAFSCSAASKIKNAILADGNWTAHLTASQSLRERFNNVSGIQKDDTAGWNTSWDHPYDNLSAKQCHQYPLPCSVNNTNTCVSQADANTIYRLGQWEYAYRWRGAQNSTLLSALTMGPWFLQLQNNMAQAISGKSCVKYRHNFAHDGSIAPVLGVLQIDQMVWPGMGSEVVFELWKKDSQDYVRVLWSGQPIKTSTPLGTLDMIPLNDFTGYLNATIPSDPVKACST